jgi:co-chaperonin GroES (HSP10)
MIQVGDRVYYNKYSGIEIEIDDIKYLLVPITEILAKFR